VREKEKERGGKANPWPMKAHSNRGPKKLPGKRKKKKEIVLPPFEGEKKKEKNGKKERQARPRVTPRSLC